MARFTIDSKQITDRESFHAVFASELKFFEGYGRNMDAWIDCMSDFHGDTSLSDHHLTHGEPIEIEITDTEDFSNRCPDIMQELIECTAFVNRRYKEWTDPAYVSLIFT